MRLLGLAAGAAMTLALPAAAQDTPLTVSAIEVEADVTSIANVEAAPYWANLPVDLQTAIATELVGILDDEGKRLEVEVTEIALADAFSANFGPEDARIVGRVEVWQEGEPWADAAYDISATAVQAAGFLASDQEIVTISPTSETFYRAAVSAFARGVAESVLTGQ